MTYEPLSKLYYKNEKNWQAAYEQRFHSYGALHFGITIRQYQRRTSHEAFLCYTTEIVQLLQSIYSLQTELQLLKQQLPEVVRDQYILQCITEEIKSTNDIEGVRSTKREIRAWLEKLPEFERTPHLKSIIEKYITISEGRQLSFKTNQEIRDFYDQFLLQEILLETPQNAPDGLIFRQGPVDIQGTTIGKTIHQGIYPEASLLSHMEKALQLLHDQNLPTLLRLALFHYFFVYLHPFYDGNGRMARFISSYFLGQEFDPCIALRLSVVIKRRKSLYYKQLQEADSEINKGDLTPFCIYFLTQIQACFSDAIGSLARKKAQLHRCKELIHKQDLSAKELILRNYLLEAALFYGMGLTIKQLMELTGHSRVTVQKLLDNMPHEQLLISKAIKPYRYKLNLMQFRH